MRRQGGILLHISSLPDPLGIGTLGEVAHKFCDFLSKSGMSAWQILPVNPHGKGNSPYSSPSSFAGNPMLIDLRELVSKGLLSDSDLSLCRTMSVPGSINVQPLFSERKRLLRLAFSRFKDYESLNSFAERESHWIYDYASFMAIKDHYGDICCQDFPDGLRNRSELLRWRRDHDSEELYYLFEQLMFSEQWSALRKYANSLDICLIGDLPIYVSPDSSDVWSAPQLFNVDEMLYATELAGCPPDAFSIDGQLWGNPTYNWPIHAEHGYSWWMSRFRHAAQMFDTVRLDHFRGFESYWSVPAGAANASFGRWIKGPGHELFKALNNSETPIDIIAEDLGFLTQEVFDLRDGLNLPGMRILQFAFDGDENNMYLPDKYIENCVAYTGTHDNDTVRGWAENSSESELSLAERILGFSSADAAADAFIRSIWASSAKLAIAPIQDFLNLTSSARMNTPSTVNDKNWTFRVLPDALSESLCEKLFSLNSEFNRI